MFGIDTNLLRWGLCYEGVVSPGPLIHIVGKHPPCDSVTFFISKRNLLMSVMSDEDGISLNFVRKGHGILEVRTCCRWVSSHEAP